MIQNENASIKVGLLLKLPRPRHGNVGAIRDKIIMHKNQYVDYTEAVHAVYDEYSTLVDLFNGYETK